MCVQVSYIRQQALGGREKVIWSSALIGHLEYSDCSAFEAARLTHFWCRFKIIFLQILTSVFNCVVYMGYSLQLFFRCILCSDYL